MRIQVTHTNVLDVHITDQQQKQITDKYIRTRFNIPDDCYLENGHIVRDILVYNGSHASYEMRIIRAATPNDIHALWVLSLL